MVKSKATIRLRILSYSLLLLIICAAGITCWLSLHYKQIIRDRLPEMVTKSSDSVYHVSFRDISINIFTHKITVTDLKLWPDEKQVTIVRARRHRTPFTLSTVQIQYLEADNVAWTSLVVKRTLNCENIIVRDLKWSMLCIPHPEDSCLLMKK